MEPRTILYVGNFTRPWCTEVHLAASLEHLGHRVVRVQEHTADWPALPALADAEQAHLLLWTRTVPSEMTVVRPVLDQLRDAGVPSVAYHLDLFLGLDREEQVTSQPFFACDLLVTPHRSERWGELGVNHLWLPPGVYHAECDPVPADPRRFPHDVIFVGSHPYPHPEWEPTRSALIGAFEAEFGDRFTVWPKRRQPIRGRDLQTLYASAKVVLGDSCLAGRVDGYWSDRVPETLGRGGYLIHPEVGEDIGYPGAWYQHGEHLSTFTAGDPDEAVQIARAWSTPDMADEREAMADRGRQLVLSRDTYVHRMEAMLDHVQEQFGWREPAPAPAPPPEVHRPVHARLHRWSARFDPRPGNIDVDGGSFVVVDEVWTRNDYRIPPAGFHGLVVDIGANVGAFTVAAMKAGASKVIAFEPHAGNRARLEHHLDLNQIDRNRVEVQPYAIVGDAAATPVVELVGVGGGVHIDPVMTAEGTRAGGGAPTLSLAQVLGVYGDSTRIEMLKCDIEGGEFDAFSGVTAAQLHDHVDRIALEWHGPVMPHLSHLDGLGFGPLVTLLADCGRVETFGHPTVGGLLHWTRY